MLACVVFVQQLSESRMDEQQLCGLITGGVSRFILVLLFHITESLLLAPSAASHL